MQKEESKINEDEIFKEEVVSNRSSVERLRQRASSSNNLLFIFIIEEKDQSKWIHDKHN